MTTHLVSETERQAEVLPDGCPTQCRQESDHEFRCNMRRLRLNRPVHATTCERSVYTLGACRVLKPPDHEAIRAEGDRAALCQSMLAQEHLGDGGQIDGHGHR